MGWKQTCQCAGFILFLLFICVNSGVAYKVGVGRADCTGPSVDIVFVSIFCLIYKTFSFLMRPQN